MAGFFIGAGALLFTLKGKTLSSPLFRFARGRGITETMETGGLQINFATKLTLARLALLPVLVLLFFIPAAWAAWTVLGLYVVGAVTDWLDGWVARRFNQVSDLGRFLDPIADKIFVATVLLMLIATDRIEGIWVLAVVIILIREFAVAGLREFLGPKGVTVPVSALAKGKTAVQMIATGILIVAPYINPLVSLLGLLGLVAAAALTAKTGWDYLKAALVHFKN